MEKVFETDNLCSGCAACVYTCPKQAIQLKSDNCGFRYPEIDQEKCISCGKCVTICPFQNPIERNSVNECLAGQSCDEKQLQKSSSGGVFGVLAEYFLEHGGGVCGAVMEFGNDSVKVHHKLIYSKEELSSLQGSKYVQSDMRGVYTRIEEAIGKGHKVMFSGTPCQVAAVKKVFAKKSKDIFCVDIVCHGVPSEKMFQDYIKTEERKKNAKITAFTFRDKDRGWGLKGYYSIKERGEDKKVAIRPNNSSFYRYFLDGDIYRESCYTCPYANVNRVGDISIGDYWGVDKFNPELLSINGGPIKKEQGVSCILINSDSGAELIKKVSTKLHTYPINIKDVMVINAQLREPTKKSEQRSKLFMAYTAKGYEAIERLYKRKRIIMMFKRKISRLIKIL